MAITRHGWYGISVGASYATTHDRLTTTINPNIIFGFFFKF